MTRKDFAMIAVSSSFREWVDPKTGNKRRNFLGWSIVGRDIGIVGKPGQQVKLDGTAGLNPAFVVKHDPERRLLYVKHEGFSSWLNRGSGLGYSPAKFVIYEYELRIAGNEAHPLVSLFGIAELPLKWKPEWAAEERYE